MNDAAELDIYRGKTHKIQVKPTIQNIKKPKIIRN